MATSAQNIFSLESPRPLHHSTTRAPIPGGTPYHPGGPGTSTSIRRPPSLHPPSGGGYAAQAHRILSPGFSGQTSIRRPPALYPGDLGHGGHPGGFTHPSSHPFGGGSHPMNHGPSALGQGHFTTVRRPISWHGFGGTGPGGGLGGIGHGTAFTPHGFGGGGLGLGGANHGAFGQGRFTTIRRPPSLHGGVFGGGGGGYGSPSPMAFHQQGGFLGFQSNNHGLMGGVGHSGPIAEFSRGGDPSKLYNAQGGGGGFGTGGYGGGYSGY